MQIMVMPLSGDMAVSYEKGANRLKKNYRKLAILAAALAVLSGCGSGPAAKPAQAAETGQEAAESEAVGRETAEREAAGRETAKREAEENEAAGRKAAESETVEHASELPGVHMTLLETSRTGAEVSFLNTTDLNIEYGDDYDLQAFADRTWTSLPYLVEHWAFASIAYTMPKDQPVSWQVNWEALHGCLEPGRYRLVKPVRDFRGTGDYTNYDLTAEFEIAAEILDKPPVLALQDSLSSTYEKFEVSAGNYTWYCKTETEGEMSGIIACGSGPLDEIQKRQVLTVPKYHRLDAVPYTVSWHAAPDRVTITEYAAADIGNADAEPLSKETQEEIFFLDVKAGRVYDIAAEWDEAKQDERGYYGEAEYVVVTE